MEVDSIISLFLIMAKDGFEAANRAWIAIREASVAPEAAARHARTRIAELDQEIEDLLGAVLADEALADLPDAAGARMSAKEIAAAERRLGELRAERDGPHPMLGAGAAACAPYRAGSPPQRGCGRGGAGVRGPKPPVHRRPRCGVRRRCRAFGDAAIVSEMVRHRRRLAACRDARHALRADDRDAGWGDGRAQGLLP